MDLQRTLKIATEIAQEAGTQLRESFYRQKDISYKSSAVDLVTQYDRMTEALIMARLQANFPHHRLMGEEGEARADTDSAYIWYIDPLDGTNNFTHGVPTFCVSMALYANETPLVGVIYDPLREELFTAAAGYGAHLTVQNAPPEPLQCSHTPDLLHSLLATGFPYDRHTSDVNNVPQLEVFLKKVQGVRRAGSAALDVAYVAAGRYDGFWEFKLKIWDVAAGVLMVQEAGGKISHIEDGRPYQPEPVLSLVVSNRYIHRAMLDTLKATE